MLICIIRCALNCTDATDEIDAFRKMLPLAKASNARLILANRRDYAAATPYTARERADLFAAAAVAKTEPDAARPKVLAWMQDRAREVYELLVHIVAEHKIPLAYPDAKTGGITVGGWSFGTTLMTALLANLASFPVGEVDLRKYLRRVVFLGARASFYLDYCKLILINNIILARAHTNMDTDPPLWTTVPHTKAHQCS